MMRPTIPRSFTLLPARIFYAADVLVGRVRGGVCPNCDTPPPVDAVARKMGGLIAIRACPACGLLYRPVGFRSDLALSAYYSVLYSCAGIATSMVLARSPERLAAMMRQEGKDRVPLVRGLVPPPATICVVGCSWGYELLPLRDAGYDVVGVELSTPRRRFGVRVLGLRIFKDIASAARACPRVDVVLSSHVLEHVPKVDGLLQQVIRLLAPPIQLHVTPNVEPVALGLEPPATIGREHPLGVTRAYWERLCSRTQLALTFREDRSEAIAVLRAPTPIS